MRILYGVHGYGRGHATRSLAILSRLEQKHQVMILAGGDAYSAIWPDHQVVRIPTFGFSYGKNTGKRSNWQTFRRNLSAFLDLKLHGPVFEMVRDVMQEFSPDLVISDAEAWTHQVADHLAIPRVSVDHIGIMAYCKPKVPWQDWLEANFDAFIYRTLMGNPERIIVSSFYDAKPRRAGVRLVPAMVRSEVRELTPVDGDHLLVYFNKGKWQLKPRILKALEQVGCPVRIYGHAKRGREGNLTFLPMSNLPFLEDLASCRAVICTAGNQLMGETIHLRKPVLVVPERCVEQRMNAAGVERLGIGKKTTAKQLTAKRIRQFLDRRDEFIANMEQFDRDGLEEAVAAIESFMTELGPANTAEQTKQPTP